MNTIIIVIIMIITYLVCQTIVDYLKIRKINKLLTQEDDTKKKR